MPMDEWLLPCIGYTAGLAALLWVCWKFYQIISYLPA